MKVLFSLGLFVFCVTSPASEKSCVRDIQYGCFGSTYEAIQGGRWHNYNPKGCTLRYIEYGPNGVPQEQEEFFDGWEGEAADAEFRRDEAPFNPVNWGDWIVSSLGEVFGDNSVEKLNERIEELAVCDDSD